MKTTIWGLLALVLAIIFCYVWFFQNEPAIAVFGTSNHAYLEDYYKENIKSRMPTKLLDKSAMDIIEQSNTKRNFLEHEYNHIDTVYLQDFYHLSHITLLDYKDNKLIVADDQAIKLKELNPKNMELDTIIVTNEGRGPGEILMSYGAAKLNDEYFISDMAGMKVVQYSAEKAFVDYPVKNAGRIVVTNDYLINFDVRENYLVDVYEFGDGKAMVHEVANAYHFIEGQETKLNLLDGRATVNQATGRVYYSLNSIGYFITFEIEKGKVVRDYFVETINQPGYLAPLASYKDGTTRLDESISVSSDVALNDEYILLIGGYIQNEDETYSTVVDYYSHRGFQYAHSKVFEGVSYQLKQFDETMVLTDGKDFIYIFNKN